MRKGLLGGVIFSLVVIVGLFFAGCSASYQDLKYGVSVSVTRFDPDKKVFVTSNDVFYCADWNLVVTNLYDTRPRPNVREPLPRRYTRQATLLMTEVQHGTTGKRTRSTIVQLVDDGVHKELVVLDLNNDLKTVFSYKNGEANLQR